MTPQERAEKIYDYIELQFDEDPTYDMIDSGVAMIAAQIEEAEREAIERIMVDERREQARLINERDNAYFKGFAAGFCEAKAMAKGIVLQYGRNRFLRTVPHGDVADRIGVMSPDDTTNASPMTEGNMEPK